MLSKEHNDLLTQTGPETPAGNLLRRYWQPAALCEELPPGGPPIPVRLMSEDLVLFRDQQGQPGLLGLHCSHRGADLSYGRLEDGGLRCIYHGWLYDVHGRCLEQPGEPSNSWTYSGGRDSMQSSTLEAQAEAGGRPFHEKIRHTAYPCQERAGIIFAYMGPGEPPLLPAYDFLSAPDECMFVHKYYHDCSYLQSNEGNIDPSHLSYLHRFFNEDVADLRPTAFQAERGSDASANTLCAQDMSPTIEVEKADFGVRIFSVRTAGPHQTYLRVTNFVYPNAFSIRQQGGWHVPIDDMHHWKYQIFWGRTPLDKERMKRDVLTTMTPDYRHIRNRGNRYLQDREEMKTRSVAGLGPVFQNHDNWATEGPGSIQDRTQEHLGYTDKAIVMARQLLLLAIHQLEQGLDPPHVVRDPACNRFPHLAAIHEVIPDSVDWRTYWKRYVVEHP